MTSMVVVCPPSGTSKMKNGFPPDRARASPSRNISTEPNGLPYAQSQLYTPAVPPGIMIWVSNLKSKKKQQQKKSLYCYIDSYNNRVGIKHSFVSLPVSKVSCSVSEDSSKRSTCEKENFWLLISPRNLIGGKLPKGKSTARELA